MPPSCALLGGFTVGALVALLWQHYGNAWQSPAVMRQAHRRRAAHAHYACRRRLPSPVINGRACCVRRSISSILRGVVTQTRHVSEYMLVLALCLVTFCMSRRRRKMYCGHARLCVCVCVCVCLSVCLSVRGLRPRHCTDQDVTWERGRGCRLCTIGQICNRCTACVAMAT